MDETQPARMKQDPPQLAHRCDRAGVAAPPIETVADDRVAKARGVDPDLVRAPRLEPKLHPRRAGSGGCEHPPVRHRALAAPRHDRHALAIGGMAAERSVDAAGSEAGTPQTTAS